MLKVQQKYILWPVILTTAALAGLIPALPAFLRIILTIGYVAGLGALTGGRFMPGSAVSWRTFFGSLAVVSLFTAVASAIYFFYRLDRPALAAALIITAAAASFMPGVGKVSARLIPEDAAVPRPQLRLFTTVAGLALAILYAGLARYAFGILEYAATDASIRSPWDVVPRMYFIIFFMLVFGVAALAFGGTRPALALPLIAAVGLLLCGVAATVYSVGFGFDPFIHQATEKVIVALGAISPKPLYYIGQYALVAAAVLMTGTSVQAADTWLVPFAITLVAFCAYWSLHHGYGIRKGPALAASLAAFLWPMSSFVMTTPQAFANVFAIMAALLGFAAAAPLGGAAGAFPLVFVVLLALAATAIHPLAGIPMLMFSAVLAFKTVYERGRGPSEVGRRMVLAEIVIVGSLALPALFVVNSWISNAGVTLNSEVLRAPSVILEELSAPPAVLRRFMAAYDIAYGWKNLQAPALFALAAAGIALLRRRKDRAASIFGWSSLMFGMNYLALKVFIRFPFLISYERSNYADRILDLTLYLLMPVALYALARAFERVESSFPLIKIAAALLLAALLTSSLYLAYPRRDKYESSHGWSTSAVDAKAVQLIEADARGGNYVALANQSVSAAAIREFGFSRYYPSQDPQRPGYFFYYPVPTGDELYKDFDRMNATGGARAAALDAMRLTGVATVYYVINDYWWDAQKNIASAGRAADRTWAVDGKSWIFKYVRHSGE